MKNTIKNLVTFLGLKFEITQYKFGRKLFGGYWYYIITNLPMSPFWTDQVITSCMARNLKIEKYEG